MPYIHVCVTDVEIKREGDKIHRVFQDPTGQHLLVCMESKECYYIGSRLTKRSQPKPLQKVKGQLIESVAWNKVDQSEHSTGAILLGTSTGKPLPSVPQPHLYPMW